MAISFHFREPMPGDIIALISFVFYLLSSLQIINKKELKLAYLFIVGSLLGVIWFIINFFIPGIILPAVPTPEEIEFTRIYGTIFNGYIQDIVLLFSLGIFPLIISLKNRDLESKRFLMIGAILAIIALLISIGPDSYGIESLPHVILAAIAMGFMAYFGFKVKYYLFILFVVLFFLSRILFLFLIF